jgi:hypothetical protein
MNRCEIFVKKLPAKDRKRVQYAVLELFILLKPLDAWQDVDMSDLILSISTKKEQQQCKEKRKR